MGIRGELPMQPSEWENSCHRIGTCALTGSAALFASIPGSYVIVNGPLWCYFYAMKYIDDSMPGAAERFYCTQPDQNSLVYGTEKDLINGFEYLKKMEIRSGYLFKIIAV